MGDPTQGLSPKKLHLCSEHEPRSCWEVMSVCGASGRDGSGRSEPLPYVTSSLES